MGYKKAPSCDDSSVMLFLCFISFFYYVIMLKDGIVDQANIHSPLLISLYGGLGISLGLIMFGKRVIRTMGSNISRMTPSRYQSFPQSHSIDLLFFNIYFGGGVCVPHFHWEGCIRNTWYWYFGLYCHCLQLRIY